MEYRASGNGIAASNKIWANAVNTLLSAMESILLDEDLQPLWPREHQNQDSKKKHSLPSTPTIFSHHDPGFSPPLKRKTDPTPPPDRSAKSQRMTDHITARLATSLHVSSSTDDQPDIQNRAQHTRGFHRIQDLPPSSQVPEESGFLPSHDALGSTLSEPRKYRKAVRNRSNPSTPVSSHPPSPGTLSVADADDLFSSLHSAMPTPGSTFESFAMSTSSPNVSLNPTKHLRPSSLLMRRENRVTQQPIRSSAHHHLAMATRLALFHRLLSTTKSPTAQAVDKDVWISEQVSKRGFPDRPSFEAAMNSHNHILVAALASLRVGFAQQLQGSYPYMQPQGQGQEVSVYNSIQTTVDAILENARWLCGPEFEMGINRICPQWSIHEGSMEHMVHYVQVVETMKEILSVQLQHSQDLSDDLKRSQEVVDYQKTLLGNTLCSHGLEWRALGLPAMEELIQSTQDWILNLATVLTIKIRGEVNLALERSTHTFSTTDPSEMDMADDGGRDSTISGQELDDLMNHVIQGALLSKSCLELVGKKCPMLVTAWIELASQYCAYALLRHKERVIKAGKATSDQAKRLASSRVSGTDSFKHHRHQYHQHPSLSRGMILKTMESFENVSRLLQCLMEMREEEEERDQGISDDGQGTNSEYEDSNLAQGTSATSSDQDDAMDVVSASSSSVHQPYGQHHQHQSPRSPRTVPLHQRRIGVDPIVLQRLVAMESLASVLVETGLELCETMAEILGCRHHSTPRSRSSIVVSFDGAVESGFLPSPITRPAPSLMDPTSTSTPTMSSSARAAAALSSLSSFAGGGVVASGTGGVGFIFVQFVVRLVSRFIEFSQQGVRQEQRLLRVHASLQNLENALSA
ncbi:hypothetical protein B0O80DRAFT_281647 [Mortierella sp. GBAus27b]|nr:hypothetical protein B0O80DRAFT_281647 [Mortierella sp. GBAus27b]